MFDQTAGAAAAAVAAAAAAAAVKHVRASTDSRVNDKQMKFIVSALNRAQWRLQIEWYCFFSSPYPFFIYTK